MTQIYSIDIEELREICELTYHLTELRQKECKHLAIENFAPDMFFKLLTLLDLYKKGELQVNWEIYPGSLLHMAGKTK